jgi:hypothetical protein
MWGLTKNTEGKLMRRRENGKRKQGKSEKK